MRLRHLRSLKQTNVSLHSFNYLVRSGPTGITKQSAMVTDYSMNQYKQTNEARLVYLFNKDITKESKNSKFYDESKKFADLRRLILEDRNYQLMDIQSDGTIKLIKSYPSMDMDVIIDFDSCSPNNSKTSVPLLFDMIIKKKSNNQQLVLTCSTQPKIQFLSLRFVPSSSHHLDQSIFDGPDIPSLTPKLKEKLLTFISHNFGIDSQLGEFITLYSHDRYRKERISNLQKLVVHLQENHE